MKTDTELPITVMPNPSNMGGFAVYGVYGAFSDGAPKIHGLGRFTSLDDAVLFAVTVPVTWTRPNGKTRTFTEVRIYPMTWM